MTVAEAVDDRVGVLGIDVGVDVVAGGLGRVRGQPRIGDAVGVGVEALDGDERGVRVAVRVDVGEAGRVRVEIGERAVERPAIAGVGVHAILMGVQGGVAAHQQPAVVGGDDVLKHVILGPDPGLQLDEVGGDERLAEWEVDRSRPRRLDESQALACPGSVRRREAPPLVSALDLDERHGDCVAVEVAQGRRDRGLGEDVNGRAAPPWAPGCSARRRP
ncbi:hypothetical protein [Nannocystis pusilla]|uniref:hypothetical protein n=1 Tax=Nannocystis pusilla TaxID=889268 RepID=UPI003B7BEAB4